MKSIYFENDHILQIRVSEIQTAHEVLQDTHTNISYAEDGSTVEIVLIDANKGRLAAFGIQDNCLTNHVQF